MQLLDVGHHSEVHYHALYMALEFLPVGARRRSGRVLWSPAKDPPAFEIWSTFFLGTAQEGERQDVVNGE